MKVASASTKERLTKLINDYYFTTSCIINDNNEVWNTKLNKKLGKVEFKRSTFIYYCESAN